LVNVRIQAVKNHIYFSRHIILLVFIKLTKLDYMSIHEHFCPDKKQKRYQAGLILEVTTPEKKTGFLLIEVFSK